MQDDDYFEYDADVDPRPRDRWGRFLSDADGPAHDAGYDDDDDDDDDDDG